MAAKPLGDQPMPIILPPADPAPPALVSPATAPLGRTITVDPNGPISTISAGSRRAYAGDTVLILPGVYHEWFNQTESGQEGQPITFVAQKPGTVILDATGFKTAINSNFANAHWITIKGITIHNCANPKPDDIGALNTGDHWHLEDVTVDSADGTGIEVWGDGVELDRVTVKNCGRAGLSGGGCTNVLVKDCATIGNNTKGADPDWDGGAGKWTKTDHVTIDGLSSHDNVGPGLWFDYNNTNILIRNSELFGNKGAKHAYSGDGLRLELDPGPIQIENCKFHDNTGNQISIQSCRHVNVKENSFVGATLDIRDWPRGDDYTTQDLSFVRNRMQGTKISASGGTWNDSSAVAKRIAFSGNVYVNPPSLLFIWGGSFYSLEQAKGKLGVEK
jgi:Right handed beta helix region